MTPTPGSSSAEAGPQPTVAPARQPPAKLPPVPLGVQLAVTAGAWLTSILSLLALGVTLSWLDDEVVRLVIGGGACVLAAAVNRRRDHGLAPRAGELFLGQLMLVLGLVGFGLVVSVVAGWTGLYDEGRSLAFWLITSLAAGVLVWLNPESTHRFVMATVATIGVGFVVAGEGGGWVLGPLLVAAVTAIWLGQESWSRAGLPRAGTTVGAAVTAVTLLVLPLLGSIDPGAVDRIVLAGDADDLLAGGHVSMRLALQLALALALAATTLVIWRRRAGDGRGGGSGGGSGSGGGDGDGRRPGPIVIVALVVTLAWWLLRSPTVAACLLVWLLTIASGHRRLAVLALLALAAHLGFDYYSMETTLMNKGLDLIETAIAGLLLPLALAWQGRRA